MKRHTVQERELPMLIPDSPHWSLPRARVERDRLADWLKERACGRVTLPDFLLEALRFQTSRSAYSALFDLLRCDTVAINRLRQLYHLACYVALMEAAATPPPGNPRPRRVTQAFSHAL